MPPFVFYSVPLAALQYERAVPKLNELRLFGEGMATCRPQFDFRGPDRDFLQWTYDNHIAACVEIGQKVEAQVGGGMTRGVIEDIFLEEVTLRINDTEVMGVDVHGVRRFYEVGDAVKVVKASNLNREGWVVHIGEGEIEVFDRNAKEHVGGFWSDINDGLTLKQFHVKSWQLIPHESFEWGLPRRIQVGDSVRVVNLLSAEYKEGGRVYNVTELGVEVIGDRPNTKVHEPDKLLIAC